MIKRVDLFQVIPSKYLHKIHRALAQPYGLIVKIDQNGNIVGSLHDPSGYISSISEVVDAGNVLFFGTYFEAFIGKVNLE